jgi:glycerate-2-kinase
MKDVRISGLEPHTELRDDAKAILSAGIAAIDTEIAVRRMVHRDDAGDVVIDGERYALAPQGRVFVVAIGKCANDAAAALEAVLGDRIHSGFSIDIETAGFKTITSRKGGHPFPNAENVRATEEVITLLDSATEEDLVIAVISGGGSSLLCSPFETDCDRIAALTSALMARGATIAEINTVRKHTSKVQGGRLAQIAHPARVAGLVFSDVPGDDVALIASGPLSLDITTNADAEAIIERYGLGGEFGDMRFSETPKEPELFARVALHIAVSNKLALNAMRDKAEELGYSARIETSEYQGDARETGARFALEQEPPRSAVLVGGEMTVTVRGDGKGGRNQEAALAACTSLAPGRLVAFMASDGRDNTDAAGAFADMDLVRTYQSLGINPDDYLARSDAYGFFERVGGHIHTGPTGSNVSDLAIILTS